MIKIRLTDANDSLYTPNFTSKYTINYYNNNIIILYKIKKGLIFGSRKFEASPACHLQTEGVTELTENGILLKSGKELKVDLIGTV